MSRRSSRNVKTEAILPTMNNDIAAAVQPSKKRGRKSGDVSNSSASNVQPVAVQDEIAMPPPSTPVNKKRRTMKEAVVPPLTPTPSAIGVMLDKPRSTTTNATQLAETRSAQPHQTNGILSTPNGTQVVPHINESPSRPRADPISTTSTLLDDAIKHLVSVDSSLESLINRHHCKVFSQEGLNEETEPFHALVSSILSQQVSGAAAKSIKNKFIALFPAESSPNGFPTPAIVAETAIPTLRTAGLSQRKAEYVQGLAEKFASGELTVEMLMNGSDEEVMEKLVAVRGLGVWSVQMFMCFALKRMDIFSTGDLGVQRGMAVYKGKDVSKLKAKGGKWKYMSEQDMLSFSEPFKPYRSLFMWYMWRMEDVDTAALGDT